MKKYLFFLILAFTISAQADWVKISEFNSCGETGYYDQSTCQKINQETCAKRPMDNCEVFKLVDVFVSDEAQPIYSESGHVTCLKFENEESELPLCSLINFACEQGEIVSSEDELTISSHCKVLQGYEPKFSHKIIEVDQVLLSQKQAQEQASQQLENLINEGKKARETCNKVLDLIGGFNLQRTSSETDALSSNFASAKTFLMEGRPGKAKYQIQQIPVDGVLVTQEMKSLVLSLLNDYEAVQ